MRKILFIFLIIAVFISISVYVSASRTEFSTDQICNIEGTIQSVEFKEAFRDSCLDDNSCPIGGYDPDRPARYYLKILLSFVSCEPDKSDDPYAYEYQFPLDTEVEVYINKNQILNEDFFELGQKISGQVKYFLGHSFTSYKLEKPTDNFANDNIDTQDNIINENQKKLNNLSFLFVCVLVIIVLIIMAWFFFKKRK